MADLRALRRAVAQAMVSSDSSELAAAAVCRCCVEALPVDGAAFTAMTSDPMRELLYASDAVATEIAELQFSLGEGPCLEAFTQNRPVYVPDLSRLQAARWPGFGPVVTELPIGALFAFPVAVGAITIGVFDLYRLTPGDLSAADLASILQVTDLTGSALLALRAALPALDGDGTADGVGADRQTVHQATGMLIAQLGVSAEDAFARLRGYAYARDQLIGVVAEEIVARRLLLNLEPD